MSTLGFLGLGRMGQAMAPRLLDAGFNLVVWNRSPEAASVLQRAGAQVVAHPCDIWDHADIAITMLRDFAAMQSVLQGPQGLLSEGCAGKLICDMATYAPADSLALAASAEEQGARYVDAPVGGTVEPARSGNLVVFTGGRSDDTHRLQDVLAPLSRRIFDMGQQGNGAKMKMVMNLVLTVYWEGIAEALAMADGGALDPAIALDVLVETPAAIPILQSKRALLLDQSHEVGFDINGVQKDMNAVMRTVTELGLSAPAAAGTLEAVNEAASSKGYGEQDVTKLTSFRRTQIGGRDEPDDS
tara:strand:- start:450 stop:1349 length:900 start_codon:yes stop_codon:yes gene_type:complete